MKSELGRGKIVAPQQVVGFQNHTATYLIGLSMPRAFFQNAVHPPRVAASHAFLEDTGVSENCVVERGPARVALLNVYGMQRNRSGTFHVLHVLIVVDCLNVLAEELRDALAALLPGGHVEISKLVVAHELSRGRTADLAGGGGFRDELFRRVRATHLAIQLNRRLSTLLGFELRELALQVRLADSTLLVKILYFLGISRGIRANQISIVYVDGLDLGRIQFNTFWINCWDLSHIK